MHAVGRHYVGLMDRLYLLCIVVCVISVVCMTVLIFSGVVMRYIFEMGARFAEPMSIFFTVQLTMYGAAACYRAQSHLSLQLFVKLLPERWQSLPAHLVHALMAGIALFMVVYGFSLAQTTWFQSYPEFDEIKVGVVYSAIPGSGVVTLLFVIESVLFGEILAKRRAEEESLERALEHGEEEARRLNI